MLYFIVYVDGNMDIHTNLSRDLPFEFMQNNKDVHQVMDAYDARFDDTKLQRAFERLLMMGGHFDANFKPGKLVEGLFNFAYQSGLSSQ